VAKKKKVPFHIKNNLKQYSYEDGGLTITYWAKVQEDPRVQVSEMLQGPVRGEGESYEDYKIRMKVEYKLTRDYLKGYLIPPMVEK
jgi:hypothetical protein